MCPVHRLPGLREPEQTYMGGQQGAALPHQTPEGTDGAIITQHLEGPEGALQGREAPVE